MPLLAPVTTAVRCMVRHSASPARGSSFPVRRDGQHVAYYRFVAELRGVIFDWGGVLTTPIIQTVHAWLEADRIDRESYAAAMRPWISQAYGPDAAESPVHALERGEISDAEFEVILADLLID